MTATANDVYGAIIRARTAADALRDATAAMVRDGGNESAPSWAVYVAALAAHDAAERRLIALVAERSAIA